jgi:ABC-2 type transport system permease protein
MPEIMQKIVHLLPLIYAIEALRKVIILGGGIANVQKEILILLGIGVVTLSFAVPMFKKLITR